MKLSLDRIRRKLTEWIKRYAPAEIIGTITAMGSFWIAHNATDSLAIAAIAGTIGENIGYYGTATCREVLRYWRVHHYHARLKRLWLTGAHSLRDMVMEFGLAEILDSFVVRPGLFYLFPMWFSGNMALALLAAKLIADLVFYAFAITAYEFRKRLALSRGPK